MFRKIMASLGVGAAKVNLVLDSEQVRIGERITGRMILEGGNVDQSINRLDVDVIMKVSIRGKELTRAVDTIQVARDFPIKARETRELSFDYLIPFHYPISKGTVTYALQTKMDIAQAVDTGDNDILTILPSRDMQLVFDALQGLGFREKIGSGKVDKYGQRFAFYPSTNFAEQLREMDMKFFAEGGNLKLYMELELTGGFMRNGVKHHTELTLPAELLAAGQVAELQEKFTEFLEGELKVASVEGPRLAPSYQNYQHHPSHGSYPFGGFMGGMVAGMLGGALLGELFDNDDEPDSGEIAGDEGDFGGDDGGFDLGFGDFFGGDDDF